MFSVFTALAGRPQDTSYSRSFPCFDLRDYSTGGSTPIRKNQPSCGNQLAHYLTQLSQAGVRTQNPGCGVNEWGDFSTTDTVRVAEKRSSFAYRGQHSPAQGRLSKKR